MMQAPIKKRGFNSKQGPLWLSAESSTYGCPRSTPQEVQKEQNLRTNIALTCVDLVDILIYHSNCTNKRIQKENFDFKDGDFQAPHYHLEKCFHIEEERTQLKARSDDVKMSSKV